MRRLVLPLAMLLCLALVSSAGAATIFILKGRGWGHGVGMSQWGAFAQAREGTGYRSILAHYYRGTTVTTRSNKRVKVLLASGRSSVRVGSSAPFEVGAKEHAAGSALVTPTSTGRIKVEGIAKTFASPVTFAPTSSPLALDGLRYRGKLVVSVSGGRLRVLNRLRMEAYIAGVVPRESPSSWPLEALKAQAVAARSYAFALGGKCGDGAFCPDTRDQVYGGLGAETPSTNQAVADTAGEVLEHSGAVIPTYFHSSSGGRTAASVDIWSCDCPYLQSEPDFDLVAENPNRLWFVRLKPKQLGARLGTRRPTAATLTRNGSDRAQRLTVSGGWGSRAVEGSETLRFRLGVKSSRFWLGILRLNAPAKVVFKTTISLPTLVQEIDGAVLEGRPYGGSWQALAAVPAGAGATSVRPTSTTKYRLASSWGRSLRVQVLVAARINFAVEQPPDGLAGVVKPKRLAGTPVTIQRRSSGSWRAVATATVGATGAFKGTFTVTAGKYRAVVEPAAGSGLVTGKSPVLTLTTG